MKTHIFDEKGLNKLTDLYKQGVPIEAIAQVLTEEGYKTTQGLPISGGLVSLTAIANGCSRRVTRKIKPEQLKLKTTRGPRLQSRINTYKRILDCNLPEDEKISYLRYKMAQEAEQAGNKNI